MTNDVTIFEVGPRDGLQNIPTKITADKKIELINLLSQCGFTKIEAASFVSPKWVPQMADGETVLSGIKRNSNTSYAALTPNLFGYNRARTAKADEVAIFVAASETFSQKNTNCSIAESIERFDEVLNAAKSDNIKVRGYISCVIECPYEGKIAPERVADLAQILFDKGCYEISLGDTIGKGNPQSISAMLEKVISKVPAKHLAGHFHDTGGNAVANILASAKLGVRTFDSAVGGLGGCPYAPGAKGNVATRDAVIALENIGLNSGIDLQKLEDAENFLAQLLEEETSHG